MFEFFYSFYDIMRLLSKRQVVKGAVNLKKEVFQAWVAQGGLLRQQHTGCLLLPQIASLLFADES